LDFQAALTPYSPGAGQKIDRLDYPLDSYGANIGEGALAHEEDRSWWRSRRRVRG
jgi:hypothetical protein